MESKVGGSSKPEGLRPAVSYQLTHRMSPAKVWVGLICGPPQRHFSSVMGTGQGVLSQQCILNLWLGSALGMECGHSAENILDLNTS